MNELSEEDLWGSQFINNINIGKSNNKNFSVNYNSAVSSLNRTHQS